ncbi:MAG TPA: sulfurtransferase [Streptosporangiaceae bacterium]|nr:sulfurtransferase [Streptosporangiaceae bacterium]
MTDPLTDAAALAAELGTPVPPVLLDVRWRLNGPPGIDAYRAGHLPGARFIDLDRDLAAPPGPGGRHPLPAPDAFQAAMRRAGVSEGGPVVVYDEDDSVAASRAWWVLRYFGHDQVRVLDGGYRAWLAAGAEVTAAEKEVTPGNFTARPGHMPLLDAAGAARTARRGVLLDARAAPRYRGEEEPVDRVAGHIPGAVNAPSAENVTADGRFLGPARLRSHFEGLGVGGDGIAQVAVYCGSGVTAAHDVLALDVAGIRAALYAGSWSEWITDPERPVATGPQPG